MLSVDTLQVDKYYVETRFWEILVIMIDHDKHIKNVCNANYHIGKNKIGHGCKFSQKFVAQYIYEIFGVITVF